MTSTYQPEMKFVDGSQQASTQAAALDEPRETADDTKQSSLPPAILSNISPETKEELKIWIDRWIYELEAEQASKQKEWSELEASYKAGPEAPKSIPFEGACNDVIPLGGMAVDPVHARLETGIFKTDRVFVLKPLKKSVKKYSDAVERWVDFYQRNILHLRQLCSPRILEFTKLGTMVFKTVYEKEEYDILHYELPEYKVIKKKATKFAGPMIHGISLGDFLFPSNYQNVQHCPVVFERQRTTYSKLKVAEASGKLANVDSIKDMGRVNERTQLELAREDVVNHKPSMLWNDEIVVYEGWCDYDIDGDGLPEHLVLTYQKDKREFLQLRLNWYFHQRKPYTVIPYMVQNETLYGLGVLGMTLPFQKALTRWHQMATDNTYLANIRMFIAKKNSDIEEVPRLYSGRVFYVDDPSKDFIPFAMGDIYPSTLTERQNLFGMAEKRTGISDYLTGRESPIVGSRATATSTIALIQEGTRRVEEVLENMRYGFSEILENCFHIWIQFGLGDLDDIVFSDDDMGELVKEFFDSYSQKNVNGAFAIDLAVTDATTNRQAMQQMQLQIINVMMQYLEKLLQAGESALMAIQQGVPQYAEMVSEVMKAARQMFIDLLQKYDIRNPEDYVPDLEKYLNATLAQQQAGAGGPQGQPGGPQGQPGVPASNGAGRGPVPASPAQPGSGGGPGSSAISPGILQSLQGGV